MFNVIISTFAVPKFTFLREVWLSHYRRQRHSTLPTSDENVENVHKTAFYSLQYSVAFTARIRWGSQVLECFTRSISKLNFTETGQEMWEVQALRTVCYRTVKHELTSVRQFFVRDCKWDISCGYDKRSIHS
jgi:hypothetical protein